MASEARFPFKHIAYSKNKLDFDATKTIRQLEDRRIWDPPQDYVSLRLIARISPQP
jgi:hypothetical protein